MGWKGKIAKTNYNILSDSAYTERYLGIPLTEWAPADIPSPKQDLHFTLDAGGKSIQEILTEAVLYTYNVTEDSRRLRENLASFEKLRGDYQVRREFKAFTIKLVNGSEEALSRLSSLGFKTEK